MRMRYLLAMVPVALFAGITTATAQTSIDSGMVAWYPLNGNGNDSTAGAQHLTNDGATATMNRFNHANGAMMMESGGLLKLWNDAFELEDANGNLEAASVSVWVKTSSTAKNATLIQVNGNTYYVNRDGAANAFSAAMDGSGNNNSASDKSTTDINDGQWHHVLATNDGDSTRLYVDGDLEATYAETFYSAKAGNLTVGNQQNEMWPYEGAVDDIRIYSRALSAAEVAEVYASADTSTASSSIAPGIAGSLEVYPNPSSGMVNIEMSNIQGNATVHVYDLRGREVYSRNLSSQSGARATTLHLEGVEAGLYIMKLTAANGTYTGRLVIE